MLVWFWIGGGGSWNYLGLLFSMGNLSGRLEWQFFNQMTQHFYGADAFYLLKFLPTKVSSGLYQKVQFCGPLNKMPRDIIHCFQGGGNSMAPPGQQVAKHTRVSNHWAKCHSVETEPVSNEGNPSRILEQCTHPGHAMSNQNPSQINRSKISEARYY